MDVQGDQVAQCMNKSVLSIVLCLLFGYASHAQTYYYKLTKTIINGQQNTNVSGGQFVTFDGKKCFESDKYGKNVGNGSLAYDAEYSKVNETYWGSCYYSKNAYFKFNSDRSLLNIDTNSGKIYVYKRTTPPTGVTTCSLIHEKKQSGGGGGGGTVIVEQHGPMQVWVPCGGCSMEPGRCTYCHGSGWGYNDRLCSRCGGSGKCTICNGTGGHNEVQYR